MKKKIALILANELKCFCQENDISETEIFNGVSWCFESHLKSLSFECKNKNCTWNASKKCRNYKIPEKTYCKNYYKE